MKNQLFPEPFYQAMQKCIEDWTRREVAGVTEKEAVESGHNFARYLQLIAGILERTDDIEKLADGLPGAHEEN